jgi:hypothetical protein
MNLPSIENNCLKSQKKFMHVACLQSMGLNAIKKIVNVEEQSRVLFAFGNFKYS